MKRRLDAAMVHRGLVKSRNQAQELITSGVVLINGIAALKVSTQVADDVKISLAQTDLDVGRGAKKLRNALAKTNLAVSKAVCLDLGASTGGFTQVLLEHHAQKVYAVDVGYGQLDWSLRNNPKVVTLERLNARKLTFEDIGEKVDLVVADLSFISLTKVLPTVIALTKDGANYLLMVKPQFELAPAEVGPGGVVNSVPLRVKAIWKVIEAAKDLGLNTSEVIYSGLPGPSGNKEFFIRMAKHSKMISESEVLQIVEGAQS